MRFVCLRQENRLIGSVRKILTFANNLGMILFNKNYFIVVNDRSNFLEKEQFRL